jgi:hypothetical protein
MEARRSTVIKSDEEIRTASEKRTKDGKVSDKVAEDLRQREAERAKAEAAYAKKIGMASPKSPTFRRKGSTVSF